MGHPAHYGRAGCGWTARSSTWDRTRPASAFRHRGAETGPLFEHPDAVPQLSRQLEVFSLDGAPQLGLQLEQAAAGIGVAPCLTGDRVALPDVLAGTVQPAQQVAKVPIECHVALIAPQAARVAEVAQGAAARRAAHSVGGRRDERRALPQRAEEIAQRALHDRAARLHALLLGTLLAQVERDLGVMLDLGEVDDRVPFLAVIAQHQGIASTELTVVSRPSSSKSTRSARPASWRLWVTTTTAVSYSRASRKKISC